MVGDVETQPQRWAARVDLLAVPRDATGYTLRLEVDRRVRSDSVVARRLAGRPDVVASAPVDGVVSLRYRPLLGQARRTTIGRLHEVAEGSSSVTPYRGAADPLAIASE